MLKVWNVSLIVGTFALALLGHVPGALRRPRVDPRLRRLDRRRPVPRPDRGRRWSARPLLIVSRLDDLQLGAAHRLARSRARRSSCSTTCCSSGSSLVIFWGTFFPLISEAFTGTRHRSAAPWFDHYVTPLAIVLVLFTGIGPLFAWGRSERARHGACCSGRRSPRRRRSPWRCSPSPTRPASLWALCVLRLRRLRLRRACAGVLARRPPRRALTGEADARALGSGGRRATGAATAATSSTPGSRSC